MTDATLRYVGTRVDELLDAALDPAEQAKTSWLDESTKDG